MVYTKKLEQFMVKFLWAEASIDHNKYRVAENEVTWSKCEGGLGIKKLSYWNKTTILKHLWYIMTDKAGNV